MKKILLIFILFAFACSTNAQNINDVAVMQLVAQNAAAIGLQNDQVKDLKLSSTYSDAGTQYVYLLQTYKGVPIYNQMLVLAFKNNKLISHSGSLLPDVAKNLQSANPSVSALNAVTAALVAADLAPPTNAAPVSGKENGKVLDFGKLNGVSESVTAELMWLPNQKDHSLNLIWQVQVVPAKKSDYWLMQVDATTGSIAGKVNLTVFEQRGPFTGAGLLTDRTIYSSSNFGVAQKKQFMLPPPTVTSGTYNVVPFPYESPSHHALGVVTSPWLNSGAGNNAVTNGWHFDGTTNYDITRGNNVHAYLDVDNNNTPNQTGNNFSAQSTTAIPSLTFNFTPDFNQDPGITANKNAAITNLFYWNNLMHDVMYQYGFTEPAGNFQTDNIGRGGLGNDYVQAEAQDGGGTNNANFATPVDGSRPRMQMYLFDAVPSVVLKVNTPPAIAGNYVAVESGFSTANKLANVGPVTGQVVYFNDASGGTHLACTGAPSNSLTGKIALINRGTCSFVIKVKEAQNAGAIAVIMVNNAPGAPIVMGGTDNTITIPAVMISDVDGAAFAAQLANNLNVTLSVMAGQRLDGDLDDGVITHEFMHGISNRLTGGPANTSCLNNAEQGGEGWSDYSSLMMTTNWATATVNDGSIARPIGTYVLGQPIAGAGIRNYPYSTDMAINPLTYANMGTGTIGTEVHNIGEIWCVALWDMTWAIIQQENSINPNLFSYTAAGTGGNSIALKLVLEGMKLQPCSPGFIDARNAILQADQNLYAGRHYCAIWAAFAKRGMGYSANQGLSTSATDQTAAFDMPPAASFTTQPASTTVCLGTPVMFSATVTNTPGAPAVTYKWQVSTNNGGTWADIVPAVTTTSYTFTPVLTDNGKQYRLVAIGACSTVNSNAATLSVVTVTTGGTLSPAATNNVCAGASGNSTTLTLSSQIGNIIQWEYSTDGGVTFPNVVANTTTTLVATNVTTSRVYRVKVQSTGCAVQYSSNATINVIPGVGALTITANQGTTLCQGDPTLLTVMTPTPGTCTTASGTIALPIPDASATGATSTLNVSCAPAGSVLTSAAVTLNITHTWDGDLTIFLKSPGNRTINLIASRGGSGDNFTNTVISTGSTTSLSTGVVPFTGTFAPDLSATAAAPTGWAQTDATVANFILNSTVVNGNWVLAARDNAAGDVGTIQNWSLALGYNILAPVPAGYTFSWSPATGLNNAASNPVAASPAVSTTYTVTVTNAAGCTGTASIPITVNTRPAFITQPVAATVCAGSNATFAVTATGTGITYQWQVSTDNCATYSNIAGATTNTLTLTAVTNTMNNNGYRCVISGTCPPAVNSNCVKLTVNALPVVTITPAAGCGGVAGINGLMLTTGGQASPPPIPGSKTFTSATVVPVPDNSAVGATSVLNVAGIPANATVTNVTVTLNMSHTYPADMTFNLKGANGIIANLYKHNKDLLTGPASGPATWGWYGAQVSGNGTAPFSSVAAAPYIYGSSPVFTPDLFNGLGTQYAISDPAGFASTATSFNQLYTPAVTTTINGPWTLAMADGGAGDIGTLSGWSLKIDYTTPDPATPPITYTWSPAAGLYTDAAATVPYVSGTATPTVYAAPTVFTTYTATAVSTATGCVNSASALINYTPPAPAITPNPTALCLGGPAVKLTNSSAIPVTVKTFKSASLNLVIPDNDPTGVTTTLNVTGIPANVTVTKMNVKLNISHTWVGDVVVALKSPNNGTVNLDYALGGTDNGPTATGFVNTVISSAGGASLSSGVDPFTGTFAADGAPATNNPTPSPLGMNVTTTKFIDLLSPASGVNGTYTLGLKDIATGDVGKLTSWEIEVTYINGVPSTPAVWTPVTGLFSDAAATLPYVAGTAVDSVWANPAATTTYSVNVNSFAGPTGPSQPVTSNLAPNIAGGALVTFNFKNNNSYPVIITDISSIFEFGGLPANVGAYYKTSAISSSPGAISAANGWTSFGSGSVPEIGGVVQPFLTGLSLAVPAGATYGIAVEGYDFFGANLLLNGPLNAPTTFTTGGCSIITGPNIGYAGTAGAPAAPTFTPYGFIGNVSFAPAGQCMSPARSVTVTVNTPIVFTQQPVNATVCENGTTSFTAAVTGSSLGHNWQVSTTNGSIGSFTNLTDGGVYSGSKTGTLTITKPTLSMNTYTYRDSIAAASCNPGISAYVNLTVNPAPKVTITPVTLTRLLPGLKTTLTAVSNPAAAVNGYNWFRNGVLIPGATSNTYLVDIDHLGVYTATTTDINNCGSASLSNAVTISDSTSGKVFIYPSPNTGQFQVRYNNTANGTNFPRGLNVYDAQGKRVLTQTYPVGVPYARMDVDLRNLSTGVYWIEVVDASGNRLAIGRTEVLR